MESMRSSAASLNEESVLALVKPFFGTSQWRHLILYVHFVAGYPQKNIKGIFEPSLPFAKTNKSPR